MSANKRGIGTAVAGLISVVCGIASLDGCHGGAVPKVFIDTALVSREPITISVSATGTIEPLEVVQVKSKASGVIIKMPVSMGTVVKSGDLIAQIDPRDPQSRYDQAVAGLNAATANVQVTKVQLGRADTLFSQRAITAEEHEVAVVAYANAQSSLATAKTNLEVAQIALADVTIHAPQAGTIIDKQVSEGQVIASATSNVSGGTTLVTLADLHKIVDSALVTESDIGEIHIGEPASVTVDAYPSKVFHGVVDQISPEAVTVQSVTMFPVIIRLDNSSNLLKPGMNSDVSVLVAQRANALIIPNDAIGTTQDLAEAESALGVDAANPSRVPASHAPGGGRRGRGRTRDSAGGTVSGRGAPMRVSAGVSDTNTMRREFASSESHSATVLMLQGGKWMPRHVTLGIGNYDVTEVLSGLQAGDRVALVSEIRVQAAHDSLLTRIQGRGGLAGFGGGPGGGRRGGGGGRGGARG